MTPTGGIVQVSDISVGSGNFDSLSLLRSLVDLYGIPATILEPDQQDKAISQLEGGLEVERIPTSTHFRSTTGRIEFVSMVAARINQLKPRILIIRCSWNIPVLFRLAKKPPLVIYHATESTTYYGNFDPEFNRHARQWIDVVVFPEENRAAIDIRRCGFEKLPVALAYNSPTRLADLEDPIPPADRNGRIYYSGALDVNATLARSSPNRVAGNCQGRAVTRPARVRPPYTPVSLVRAFRPSWSKTPSSYPSRRRAIQPCSMTPVSRPGASSVADCVWRAKRRSSGRVFSSALNGSLNVPARTCTASSGLTFR